MNQFIQHPLHRVDPEWSASLINAIVEIPMGSRIKYEIDKKSGLIKMDRILSSSFEYPANYGFIPQTLGEDGDPLDILVISHFPMVPLCLVRSRIIGVMRMVDRLIPDDKIIAVAETDVMQSHLQSVHQLPEQFFREFKNFFEEYTKLENKKVEVLGFDPAEKAEPIIKLHKERYQEMITK